MGLRSTIASAINAAFAAAGDTSTGIKVAIVIYEPTGTDTYNAFTDVNTNSVVTSDVSVQAIRYDEAPMQLAPGPPVVYRTYAVKASEMAATVRPQVGMTIKEGGTGQAMKIVDAETDPSQQIWLLRTVRAHL